MEHHAIFLKDFVSNEEALGGGNWRVTCEHCGVSLAGRIESPGPTREILWRHDGSNWFGTFTEVN
jgi:hypothetical protein